jgi:hypothetical protein
MPSFDAVRAPAEGCRPRLPDPEFPPRIDLSLWLTMERAR